MSAYAPSEAEVEAAARLRCTADHWIVDHDGVWSGTPCGECQDSARWWLVAAHTVAPTPREGVAEEWAVAHAQGLLQGFADREKAEEKAKEIRDQYRGNHRRERFPVRVMHRVVTKWIDVESTTPTPPTDMVPAAALRELVAEWDDRTYLRDDGTLGRMKHSKAELAGSAAGLLCQVRAFLSTAARTERTCEFCPSTDDVRWDGMAGGAWRCRAHKVPGSEDAAPTPREGVMETRHEPQ